MREIKFRGKRIDNGEWIYGFFVFDEFKGFEGKAGIAFTDSPLGFEAVEVDIKTVGQYTGLKDKNGVEIYEGDILHLWGGEYCQGYYEFNQKFIVKDLSDLFFLGECENIEVIGNLHDNLELWEVV